MRDFIFLLLLVGVYLGVTIFEHRVLKRYTLHDSSKNISVLHPLYLILFMIAIFTATLVFLLTADRSIVIWYIRGAFAFLIVTHARLLTLGHRWQEILIAVLAAVLLAHLRFSTDLVWIHNLFVITSIVWIGPFLVKIGFVPLKRFTILSVIWLFYDIAFVWLSPGASVISAIGSDIGFQLALMSGSSLIGTGDLLWAGLFISVIDTNRWKWYASAALLVSGLLYGIVDTLVQSTDFFPLLVIWVPVGLGMLYRKNILRAIR